MYAHIKDIPQFPHANYAVTMPFNDMDDFFKNAGTVDESPPYQRGYVWSSFQQQSYVEYVLRGGRSGKDIYWNQPNWTRTVGNTEWHNTLELVDGKQRLTAMRGFLADTVLAFGKPLSEYGGVNALRGVTHYFTFHVNNLSTKREVVEWYLGMNTGGSIHTAEDLQSAYSYLREIENHDPH